MLKVGEKLFISKTEEDAIRKALNSDDPTVAEFFRSLEKRVSGRLARKLDQLGETTEWYYPAAEYLSDAAMFYFLSKREDVGTWLYQIVLELARKPAYDWVGPEFRDHSEPFTGHLETAHLCWGISAVLDLANDLFNPDENNEIRSALFEKGTVPCSRWVKKNTHLANWRGILLSGIIVSAAILDKEEILDRYLPGLNLCYEAFQADGSYAESLQYGNYLAFALMLSYESIVRKYPQKAEKLSVNPYAKGIRWVAASMFYAKPLEKWVTTEPVARAANFNDCAALFRPSGDLLLHIAARHNEPSEAGLARWLFDRYYAPVPDQGPHELATFGMCNDWGFLTLPLLISSLKAVSPSQAALPETTSFSNGHSFIRDDWEGKTVVAINGGGDPLNGPGHLHGDLNSFILVHQQERLLADPGHSCYRNLIHGLESASQTHNTCTFLLDSDGLGLQEDKAKASLLEQKSVFPRRLILNGDLGKPIDRENRQLLIYRDEAVSVVGAECGSAYGKPIERFERFWLLAGSHVLFIVDTIAAAQPVSTVWNWVVNNRDGKTQTAIQDNSLIVSRGNAGLKLYHSGKGLASHPVYTYMHDAYHVKPAGTGEGRPGSGLVYRYTESESAVLRTAVHAIAMDTPDQLEQWYFSRDNGLLTLANPQQSWSLDMRDPASPALISGDNIIRKISGNGKKYYLERHG